MKKYTTFEIVAFVSAIMSALISAILLGIVCSFMIVTRDQQQEVRFSYDVNDEHLEQDVTVRVK